MNDRMSRWVSAMRGRRYEEAWGHAAATLTERDPARRDDPTLPYHLRWVWDGTPPDGRDVLVRCYHGLGDTIQFARFLPELAQRARSVTVEVHPRLIALLAEIEGVDHWHPFDPARPLRPREVDVEITELDFALRLSPEAAPPPYLHAPRALLPKGTIALCHAAGDWDCERNVPEDLLAPLCEHAPTITLAAQPSGLDVLNPGGCPLDLGATAALVAAADLVVTVDTMIAHLAGALGRPTWLMLKAEPDWRWNPAERGSAWYPTMRLYPQPEPGDWPSVAAAIDRDLAARPLIAAES